MKRTGRLTTALITGFALAGGTTFAQDVEESSDLFKTLDANGDGKLTASEVTGDQKRFFARLVRIGDNNDDGELTRDEFQKATSRDADTPAPPQAGVRPGQPGSDQARDPQEMFRRLDRNKDGKLTRDEIPEFAKPRLEPLFERLGKDELTVEDLLKARPGAADRRPDGNPASGSRRPGEPGDRPASPRPDDAPRPGQPGRPGDAQGRGPGPAFFRELDENKDGALSRAELERAVTLLAKLDRNGNEKLELIELFGARQDGPGQPGFRRPDGAGRPGDPTRPNGQGRPQRPGDQPATGDRPQARLQQSFGRIDQNRDGFLSRDEAPEKLKENFDRVDRNGDGKISPDEIKALSEGVRRD